MMNLFTMPLPIGLHMGGWRHRDAYSDTVMNFDQILELTRLAERGKLDAVFLADGNGVRDMDKPELFAANSPTARPAGFEPVTLFAALARHTTHIGLAATATTSYEEPYTLARKFLSLDHLSSGRAIWNVVTTSNAGDSKNFGKDEHAQRSDRYGRASEFVDVVKGLWDSWADDAFPQDKRSGRFLRPDRVKTLDHEGQHFSVQGPLNVARSPQGQPVLCMAGQSEQGKEFGAAVSDCMFSIADSKLVSKAEYEDVKARMHKYGRDPKALRILPAVCVYVAGTASEAEEYFDECQSLIPSAIGVDYLSSKVMHDLSQYPIDGPLPDLETEVTGGTNQRRLIVDMARREGLSIRKLYERFLPSPGGVVMKGTAAQVADELQDWYKSGACDGFMLQAPVMPRGMHEIVNLIVPELQRRGLFRREYTGRTLRENMGLPIPRNRRMTDV